MDIAYDLYSMTFGVSVITVVLPSWYLSLPREKQLRFTAARTRLAVEIAVTKRALGFDFGDVQIAWAGEGLKDICGMRISEIAKQWKDERAGHVSARSRRKAGAKAASTCTAITARTSSDG